MATKLCSRCQRQLAPEDFNRSRREKDGLQSRCRGCQIVVQRESIERHPERRRAEARRAYRRECETIGRRPSKEMSAEKLRAHKQVWRALHTGRLVRPSDCSACRAQDVPVHAHHEDYEAPLDVMWLCARCHGRLHAEVAA